MNRKQILIFFIYLFFVLPNGALACAVCFSGTQESMFAFYLTTILLIFLPFSMIIGIIIWLKRKRNINSPQP